MTDGTAGRIAEVARKAFGKVGVKYYGLIGIAIFIYILTRLEPEEMLGVIYGSDPFFIALGLVTSLIPFLVRTFRWKLIIDYLASEKIPFPTLVFYSMNSLLVGFFTPGRVGELLLRSKYVKNYSGISLGRSFSTVVMDRLSDVVVFLVVSMVGLSAVVMFFGESMMHILVSNALLLLLLFMLALSLKRRRFLDSILRIAFRKLVPDSVKGRVKLNYEDFFQALTQTSPRRIAVTMLVSFIVFAFSMMSYYFIAIGIGMDVPLWYLAVAVPITYIITLIPVSVSGIGTRETSYILFFSLMGVQAETALLFSLIDMLLLNWMVMIMLYLFSHVTGLGDKRAAVSPG